MEICFVEYSILSYMKKTYSNGIKNMLPASQHDKTVVAFGSQDVSIYKKFRIIFSVFRIMTIAMGVSDTVLLVVMQYTTTTDGTTTNTTTTYYNSILFAGLCCEFVTAECLHWLCPLTR